MHIDRSGLLEHGPCVRHQLDFAAGVAQTLGGGLQMLAVQRQQTHHDRLTGERVLDLGVDKIDLIQFARLEVVDGVHRDVTGALQRRGRRAVLELPHQAGVFAEGAVAHLTDDIETVVPVSLFQQELQHVLVERACHALVCRQHQIGAAGIAVLSLPLVEERMHRLIGQMGDDTGDGVSHAGEVGQDVLVVLACLAQLGGRDQIHRVRDLAGILNALDALFQQLTGRHDSRLPRRPSMRSGWCRSARE